MKPAKPLPLEVVAEINAGLRRVAAVSKNIHEWSDKLKGLGVDVDSYLFMDVQETLAALHGDLLQVILQNPQPKPAANMGWTCVPGVH